MLLFGLGSRSLGFRELKPQLGTKQTAVSFFWLTLQLGSHWLINTKENLLHRESLVKKPTQTPKGYKLPRYYGHCSTSGRIPRKCR